MAGTTSPRVAVVTGANRGIGLETSRQLVQHGLRVVMTGRDSVKLENAARSVRAVNDQVLTVPMDVADPRSIAQVSVHYAGAEARSACCVVWCRVWARDKASAGSC